jgi:hemerythrin superfamily protein
MPRSTRKTTGGRRTSRGNGARRKATNGNGHAKDAIALLKADHREVEGLFSRFEKARSDERKLALAQKICRALTVHATIEEEIFYPAFLEATDDTEIHHEAEVEHDGAKNLIAQIEAVGPSDAYYQAKVTVLSEMIKHHVKEEEKRDGMFAKAKQADMDLKALGEQLQARKAELMSEAETSSEPRERMPGALLGRGQEPADRDALQRRD